MERLERWTTSTKQVLREFFLLETALTHARSRSVSTEGQLRTLVSAADRRRAAGSAQSDPAQAAAGLELMREAIVLAARAAEIAHAARTPHAVGNGEEVEPELPDAPLHAQGVRAAVEALPARLGDAPESLSRVVDLLSDPDPLAFDRLRSNNAQERLADSDEVFAWIRRAVDERSVRQLQVARGLRLGVVALAALGLLAMATARLFKPTNIALHRPAQMSSRRPHCPPDSGPTGLAPSGLVDGHKGGTYDVCTNSEVNPWVMIDLEKAEQLREVKVFNRGDCCWGSYDLPQVLELSSDGSNFEPVARQTTAYTESSPWVVPLDGRSARYVRVRVEAAIPRELVLSEIEVYRR
jgi:hypothetical protein